MHTNGNGILPQQLLNRHTSPNGSSSSSHHGNNNNNGLQLGQLGPVVTQNAANMLTHLRNNLKNNNNNSTTTTVVNTPTTSSSSSSSSTSSPSSLSIQQNSILQSGSVRSDSSPPLHDPYTHQIIHQQQQQQHNSDKQILANLNNRNDLQNKIPYNNNNNRNNLAYNSNKQGYSIPGSNLINGPGTFKIINFFLLFKI